MPVDEYEAAMQEIRRKVVTDFAEDKIRPDEVILKDNGEIVIDRRATYAWAKPLAVGTWSIRREPPARSGGSPTVDDDEDEDEEISLAELQSARSLDQMARVLPGFAAGSATESQAHLDKMREFVTFAAAVLDAAEYRFRMDVKWALNGFEDAERRADTVTQPLKDAANQTYLAGRRLPAVWRLLRAQLHTVEEQKDQDRRRRPEYATDR